MSKVIGIVGSRRKDSEEYLKLVNQKFLSLYEEGDFICSGLCPAGADWFAVLIALNMPWISDPKERKRIYQIALEGLPGIPYEIPPIWFPAKWVVDGVYRRSAGFERNIDIAKKSDDLIAVVADDRTGGTEDTIKKFIKFHGKDNLIIVN